MLLRINIASKRVFVRCLKYSVPIEKVYTKTHRDKFQWAIDMTTEDYAFDKIDAKALAKLDKVEDVDDDDSQDDED